MAKKYIVRLAPEERDELTTLVRKGRRQAYRIKHANVLLAADADGPAWSDERIAEAFGCHVQTVSNVRQRFVEQGLTAALERKKQVAPSRQRKLDGEQEARLIALACSAPPDGRAEPEAAAARSIVEQLASLPAARRRKAAVDYLRVQAARILGLGDSYPIDENEPLMRLGLDSLMALELRNTLARSFDRPLSSTLLFDHLQLAPEVNRRAAMFVHIISIGLPPFACYRALYGYSTSINQTKPVMVIARLPVTAAQPTANAAGTEAPSATVTSSGLAPATAQLGATPPSESSWSPGVRPASVRVASSPTGRLLAPSSVRT